MQENKNIFEVWPILRVLFETCLDQKLDICIGESLKIASFPPFCWGLLFVEENHGNNFAESPHIE